MVGLASLIPKLPVRSASNPAIPWHWKNISCNCPAAALEKFGNQIVDLAEQLCAVAHCLESGFHVRVCRNKGGTLVG